ncbi:hypothetical protein [Thalassospira sp.]|uniref:hypothetical protein n=1 Tax=Thalassospira sp. TaxID=1912094 RepID=UPI00257EA938|nr:hypothetical protein [Thalassospira sp.]|tara:strand:+ start:275 stop:436 length:162 start_codon:yes stop_codon:yes gene_type:complete
MTGVNPKHPSVFKVNAAFSRAVAATASHSLYASSIKRGNNMMDAVVYSANFSV